MSSTQVAAVLLLTLASAAGNAQEQETAVDSPAVATAEQPGSEEKEAAAGESQDAANTTDADQSPFDYESSEQISEDRSVSFPTDI